MGIELRRLSSKIVEGILAEYSREKRVRLIEELLNTKEPGIDDFGNS